ncbi:hypothetical protein [Arthrobacter humicola]|uniref:hypothetical protein n=1 Tax=Arthrobacter humicola TaxID=409291 RepID=UPI0031CE1179
MATARAAGAVPVLRRAALLAGILAVIAGFLGMHILAGLHGTHGQTAHPASASSVMPAARTHSGHSPAATAPAAPPVFATTVTVGGTPMPASCTSQGSCAEKPAAHVDCTPSVSGVSLSVPPPGTAVKRTQPWATGVAAQWALSARIPGSPTPNDLSISRT